jgi:hypothetical protein
MAAQGSPQPDASSPSPGPAGLPSTLPPQLPGPLGRRYRVDTTKETQFSDSWLTLAILLLVIGLITQIGGLILIAGLLVLVSAAGWLWDWLSLQGVDYHRRFGERRAFVGETIDLDLAVINRKPLPVGWLRLTDRVPTALTVEGVEVAATNVPTVGQVRMVLALRWYEQVVRSYRLHCPRRGFYAFGPAEMEAGDIFGLFSRKRRIEPREWLIVYPKVESLADLGLPPKEPFGPVKASTPLFEDPIRTVGVRDHRVEDGFRRIHWKATARRQQLQSRVYEPATGHNLVLVLNVATSIAAHASEQRWPVGIIANGALPTSDQAIKVLPGRSPGQLTRIMEALAAVSPIATQQIEDLIRLESPRLPWGCTLVVITALVTPQLKAGLADLAAEGRRLVLVTLEAVPPDDPLLHGVLVRQVAGGPAGGEVIALPEQPEATP